MDFLLGLLGSRVACAKQTLEVATIEIGDDSVDIALYGATVVSWRTHGRERLWMSSLSKLDESGPIRGGVPIAFPQFADQGPLPLHGFARTLRWAHTGTTRTATTVEAVFELRRRGSPPLSVHDTMGWQGDFELAYTVRVGRRGSAPFLELELAVTALEDPLEFTTCLHTYLRLEDVRGARLRGLRGASYFDKVTGRAALEEDESLAVEAASALSGGAQPTEGFVDRIYRDGARHTPLLLELGEMDGNGQYELDQSPEFRDTVVFNPWVQGKKGLKGPDFDDDGYLHMLCVEPAVTREGGGGVRLASRAKWRGRQTVTFRATT